MLLSKLLGSHRCSGLERSTSERPHTEGSLYTVPRLQQAPSGGCHGTGSSGHSFSRAGPDCDSSIHLMASFRCRRKERCLCED